LATAVTLANFQTAIGEIYDAIESESWESAWKWLAKAEALNAGMAEEVGGEGRSIRRRESLKGLRETLQATQSVSTQSGKTSRLLTTQTRHNR